MGILLSRQKEDTAQLKPKPVSQILDYIATNYILTMDFQSLRKLYDKEYCDKLVILTSDIIERYFTNLEITYLAQRIKEGVEINEKAKDKVIFFNKDDLNRLDIQNSIKKKRICLSIAKFYIKIAHVFAAIVTTINPIYIYKDENGNTVKANLFEKGKIPKNVERKIYKLNICDNRINILRGNEDYNNLNENIDITINPKICSMNINTNNTLKSLEDEPGIPELEELYYDDNYNYKTGKFTGMTQKTRQTYNEDLQIFYKIFTDGNTMPEHILKFSDIKLRDYNSMPGCSGTQPTLNTKVKGNISNKLFADYAENLKSMIRRTRKGQESLLEIINKLFVYTIDPQTNKKEIRVNPELTEDKLQEIIIQTRALIIKLYLNCEVDFINGLKIYEAIVEQKILETAQNQISHLEKISEKIVTQDEVPQPAEINQLKEEIKENIMENREEAYAKEKELKADIREIERLEEK
jgi:hypothetical protein